MEDNYELLDFGGGRKLERFGEFCLDRPAPAANDVLPENSQRWREAAARFDSSETENGWSPPDVLPARWNVVFSGLTFELRPATQGQVGLFPEHVAGWKLIAERATPNPLKVLNLFAYTGGSTLAAAAAGMQVTHVDAARTAVAWARRNAELSGLAEVPVRWIVEDAAAFVKRELRRGRRYDAVILDPPSYGHGAQGQIWKLARHLPGLLADCVTLLESKPSFLMLTCHTPGYGSQRLKTLLREAATKAAPSEILAEPLSLVDASGRTLPSGAMALWLP